MKILFLHGRGTVRGGLKPAWLRSQGYEVFNPPLDDNDFSSAVAAAQREYDLQRPDVIVGSSRGGAVALNLISGQTPLVLLCPAWRYWGTTRTLQAPALILHSRHDSVIPFADSRELLRASHQPAECLLAIGDDHRLADPESLAVLDWACRTLGQGKQLPWMDGSPDDPPPDAARDATTEASYLCDSCGEIIVIPVDLSEGESQTFVEDCPVCCRPSVIHVEQCEDGLLQVTAEAAQG
ncbi:MAG: CPXCG motif-containing cysteine-rich protein [Planctomycetota bacterium]